MEWLARILVAIAVVNFLTYIIIASLIGGDALNGKAMDNHYFLSSHGHLTEVSADLYTYSLWHTRSLFVTHPLAMLAGLLWLRKRDSS